MKLSFQRMLEKETEEKDKLVEVIPAYKKLAALAANYLL